MTYKIIRRFFNPSIREGRDSVKKRGLTKEQAQAYCRDPETSSSTCKEPGNVKRTEICGPWFDAYTSEEE